MIILHKTRKEHEHQNHLEEQRNLWITEGIEKTVKKIKTHQKKKVLKPNSIKTKPMSKFKENPPRKK